MATLKISDLSPHPKNNYYFDDVSGDKWNEFLESIRKNGVREQIIVTDDMVIVSGHQRVRACKELGIQVIDAKIEHYNTDDDVVRDLIEINTKQRGVISDSEIKIGRRIKFLQDYYGIKRGGTGANQYTSKEQSGNNFQTAKTQDSLAEEFGMSKRQMANYKNLTDLIPELQSAVESGQITATTAMGFVKKLSPEEQKKLADAIGDKEKVSGKEVEKYIIELKSKDAEIERLTRNNETLDRVNKKLAREANQGGKVITETVEVEVVPDDYEETKEQLQRYKGDNDRLYRESKERSKELEEARLRVKELEGRSAEAEIADKAIREAEYFEIAAYDFIKRCGGYVWLCERANDMPDGVSKKFKKALFQLNAMTTKMLEQTGGYIDGE